MCVVFVDYHAPETVWSVETLHPDFGWQTEKTGFISETVAARYIKWVGLDYSWPTDHIRVIETSEAWAITQHCVMPYEAFM
jgi:hypothetical protein